jgi:hypothetical protein
MSEKRKIDLARFGSWIQSRYDRICARYLTIGGASRFVLTAAAFFVIALWPTIRSEHLNWRTWGGWKTAIYFGCLPIVAGLYLKYSEGMKRSRVWDKLQRKNRTSRQLITGLALKDLCVARSANDRNMTDIRERIVQAAALGVEELLGLGSQKVVATLLEFSGHDTSQMRVCCRSTKVRPSGILYPSEDMIGWDAIKKARIQIVDDVMQDQRCTHVTEKPYRSIAAVPIGHTGKAFAALSVDHEEPYAFYGRATDIAIQLEPYAASLALTYEPDAVYHACQYDPSSHG